MEGVNDFMYKHRKEENFNVVRKEIVEDKFKCINADIKFNAKENRIIDLKGTYYFAEKKRNLFSEYPIVTGDIHDYFIRIYRDDTYIVVFTPRYYVKINGNDKKETLYGCIPYILEAWKFSNKEELDTKFHQIIGERTMMGYNLNNPDQIGLEEYERFTIDMRSFLKKGNIDIRKYKERSRIYAIVSEFDPKRVERWRWLVDGKLKLDEIIGSFDGHRRFVYKELHDININLAMLGFDKL